MDREADPALAIPPAAVEPPAATPSPADAAPSPSAGADAALGSDAFGHEAAVAPVADLIARASTPTPLSIGVFGAAGAGKTTAAVRLLARLEALAGTAAKEQSGRILSHICCLRLSIPDLAEAPAPTIAETLRTALAAKRVDGANYAAFANDAATVAVDPHVAARDAMERLDLARARLDAERKTLDDVESRRARLVETILYETAGSRIDAYARARRATIEARLRSFGFQGDAITTYKDLAREAAERPGFFARVAAFLRATWAYRGQSRLLIWAIVLFFLAQGCEAVQANSVAWEAWLRGLGDQAAPIANAFASHVSWFETIRQIADFLAIVLIVADIWRAIRFTAPIFRGGALLNADVEGRRGRLDQTVAHQTRRVDVLAREIDALADQAAEAERRAGGHPSKTGLSPFAGGDERTARAREFIAHVSAAVERGETGAPRRIVFLLDDAERLSPARAAQILESVLPLLGRSGFVVILAADAARLAGAWEGANAADQIGRLIDIPVNLPDIGHDDARLATFVRAFLSGAPDESKPTRVVAAADEPLAPIETALVGALASFAARSPRTAKRFADVYRVARLRPVDKPALALALALDAGATPEELAVFARALDAAPEQPVETGPEPHRLASAMAAVNKARGAPLTVAQAREAVAVARDYRMPL